MANYVLNDTVDIRHDTAQPWLPGTVTDANAGPGGGCWEVTLDADCPADDWTGTARLYGGSDNLKNKKVLIFKHADIPNLTEGELIRTQV